MKTTFNYDTAAIALEKLKAVGYEKDFNIEFDHLVEFADDYTIDYLYRYEGESDPGDESTVYGIRNEKSNEKGVLVAGNLSFLEGKKRDILLQMELKARHDNQSPDQS